MVRMDLKLDSILSPVIKESPLQVCLEELSRVSYSLECLGGLVFIGLSLEASFSISVQNFVLKWSLRLPGESCSASWSHSRVSPGSLWYFLTTTS